MFRFDCGDDTILYWKVSDVFWASDVHPGCVEPPLGVCVVSNIATMKSLGWSVDRVRFGADVVPLLKLAMAGIDALLSNGLLKFRFAIPSRNIFAKLELPDRVAVIVWLLSALDALAVQISMLFWNEN